MSRLSLIKNYHSLIYLHDLNLYYQSYSPSISCLIEWGDRGGVGVQSYDTKHK